MKCRVVVLRRAQKQLAAIPSPHYERLRDAIAQLAAEPRPDGATKLRDRVGWRIRIGRYRVIYRIEDRENTVCVTDVGHRREIYR